jgi:predicted acetyltransferase
VIHDDAPTRDDELPAVGALLAWCFGFPAADAEPWLRRAGLENVNVRRRGGVIEASALTVPMGQYFGGKSVPMVGIAGVGTSAEARGTGAALAIMTRVLREQRAKGFAISTLYPATLGLYRKVGYERAGARFEARVPLSAIAIQDRALSLRAMTPEDGPAVEACYRAKASGVNGFVDRGPYVWQRTREPRGAHLSRGFVVGEGAHVEGYAYVHEKIDASLHFALHASDLVATTRRAYRRLLTFAADHGTIGNDLVWSAAPSDPSVQLLPRVGYDARVYPVWMLRVLDVASALTSRGWPEHVAIDVDLEVTDDVIADNAGRFTLHLAAGRAEVARGGKGSVKLDVRALAALYTGWQDPRTLSALGELEARTADLSALTSAFAGPSPWMPDFF